METKCNCKGTIIEVDGETVCRICGVVHGRVMQWTETPCHTPNAFAGAAQQPAASTTLQVNSKDHLGRYTKGAYRLQRANKWCRAGNSTLNNAMIQLSTLHGKMNLPNPISEYAIILLRKAIDSGFVTGRKLKYVVVATTLLACRKHGMPRTIQSIAQETGMKPGLLFRTYRLLAEMAEETCIAPGPEAYLSQISSATGVRESTTRAAGALLTRIQQKEISGMGPVGLAAGALYLACIQRGEPTLRSEIAKAAGVAETTVAKRYRMLTECTN